jgi:hypothetical protein
MVKEYISRDEMIEQTKARIVLGAPRFNTGLEAAIEVATSIPAADVVSVVRCKDCIHRPSRTGDYVEFPDKVCPCQCLEDPWYSWAPPDDWFCADGKRKDGGYGNG